VHIKKQPGQQSASDKRDGVTLSSATSVTPWRVWRKNASGAGLLDERWQGEHPQPVDVEAETLPTQLVRKPADVALIEPDSRLLPKGSSTDK
jgi:hypothetical protein